MSAQERAQGERTRLVHSIERMRNVLVSLEKALQLPGPIGQEAGQALTQTAVEMAAQIARHDAFELVGKEEHGG